MFEENLKKDKKDNTFLGKLFFKFFLSGVKSILGHAGSVLGLLQLLLGLAELGQVEGGDLLGLLNLLLVGSDLLLELGGQVGHAVLVLPVLVVLELELLDLPLGPLVSLHVLPSLGLNTAELNLEFTDARLQLGHGRLATTHGSIVGVSQPVLQLAEGSLESSLALGEGGGVVLLGSQLVSQAGGVNHRLLGLLLGVLGLVQQVVDLGLHGVESSLHTPLVRVGPGVDGGHLVHGGARLGQLGLGLTLAAVSRVQESPGLLHLALQSVGPALGQAGLLGHLLADPAGLLVGALGLPQLALVSLDGLDGLVVGLVGVVQGDLVLVDVGLQLLLDPQALGLGALLAFQGSLEGLHGTTVVLTGVVELLLLLGNPAVDLLLHLSQLQLGAEHLVLLGLQGGLGLLQGGLQLLLLALQSAALFVQLVDGAASISQLVQQILDLISQVLVLTADNVQLLVGLVQGGLQAESLGVEVAALRVAGVELGHQVVSLGLPLSDNLVEVTAALLGDHGGGVGPLVLHGQVLQLSVHPGLGPLV